MEYAAGGELFERIVKAGRFSEDEARYYFQQLVNGIEYCHKSVSHCFGYHGRLIVLAVLGSGASRPKVGKHTFGWISQARPQDL